MERVGLYALDQDLATTRSRGIYFYTRGLIRGLAETPDPGFEVHLFLSDANLRDFAPRARPGWMHIHHVRGRYGAGAKRLWADQGLAALLPARYRLGLVHFPKGWVPAWTPGRPRVVATLHDAIVPWYRKHHPEVSPRRNGFFTWATHHSIRRSDRILAPSRSAARDLVDFDPAAEGKITVVVEGCGLEMPSELPHPSERTGGILVIGSTAPHKATRETLHLLAAWVRAGGTRPAVTIVGLDGWPRGWGEPPAGLDVKYVGMADERRLIDLYKRHRVLVLLSEIEGFGLPALEAYALGMPVCYRDRSAVGELLADVPGGWDGTGEDRFIAAMDAALAMSREEILAVRERLLSRYNWRKSAEQTMRVYAELLQETG